MGTVAHHRDKARYFLHRARDATPAAGQTPDAAASAFLEAAIRAAASGAGLPPG